MSCKHWNHDWIAHLYGELDPADERRLNEHLSSCSQCRATLDELAASSRLLREAAPAVPAAPRVLVLRPGVARQPLWAFAAGAACALLLIAGGVVAGSKLNPAAATKPVAQIVNPPELASTEPAPTRSELDEAIQAQQQWFETRLNEIEQRYVAEAPREAAPKTLTRVELAEELTRMQRWVEVQQAADFGLVLEEVAATEARLATRVDENREALHYFALKTDPRVTEQ
jgi:hypothetical protein